MVSRLRSSKSRPKKKEDEMESPQKMIEIGEHRQVWVLFQENDPEDQPDKDQPLHYEDFNSYNDADRPVPLSSLWSTEERLIMHHCFKQDKKIPYLRRLSRASIVDYYYLCKKRQEELKGPLKMTRPQPIERLDHDPNIDTPRMTRRIRRRNRLQKNNAFNAERSTSKARSDSPRRLRSQTRAAQAKQEEEQSTSQQHRDSTTPSTSQGTKEEVPLRRSQRTSGKVFSWTADEITVLKFCLRNHGANYEKIAEVLKGRNVQEIRDYCTVSEHFGIC